MYANVQYLFHFFSSLRSRLAPLHFLGQDRAALSSVAGGLPLHQGSILARWCVSTGLRGPAEREKIKKVRPLLVSVPS